MADDVEGESVDDDLDAETKDPNALWDKLTGFFGDLVSAESAFNFIRLLESVRDNATGNANGLHGFVSGRELVTRSEKLSSVADGAGPDIVQAYNAYKAADSQGLLGRYLRLWEFGTKGRDWTNKATADGTEQYEEVMQSNKLVQGRGVASVMYDWLLAKAHSPTELSHEGFRRSSRRKMEDTAGVAKKLVILESHVGKGAFALLHKHADNR